MLVAFALLVAGCGGGTNNGGAGSTATTGRPTPGGKVVYGVESDTGGGFCLPVRPARRSRASWWRLSIYDPLTWPNDKGEYVPYLAESVTPNADFTEWTIKLRSGITFTDGTPLDADTVKLNLDSYRGKNPNISSDTVLARAQTNIADVTVADPLTVVGEDDRSPGWRSPPTSTASDAWG